MNPQLMGTQQVEPKWRITLTAACKCSVELFALELKKPLDRELFVAKLPVQAYWTSYQTVEEFVDGTLTSFF